MNKDCGYCEITYTDKRFMPVINWLRDNIHPTNYDIVKSPENEYYDRIYFRNETDLLFLRLKFGSEL